MMTPFAFSTNLQTLPARKSGLRKGLSRVQILGSIIQCFIWEASDPYLYVRTTIDGRIICGGEDEEFGDAGRRDTKIEKKTRILERKLAVLLSEVDAGAQFSWTASFGQSSSGLPSIGPIPGHPRCYAVMGYGGNGITFSMLAAQLVAASIGMRRDPDAELFAFRA